MNTHTNPIAPSANKAIITWLFVSAAAVFAMIIIGAITRLTESGLSITEWKPLIGAIPPLNDAQWQETFDLYKQTPEFIKKNYWMDLGDFQKIFFWEWLHRLWGRTIGLIYALPLVFFWLRGMIPQGYKIKFLAVFLLGGAQGFMGWYMVKSGLVDMPAVSHFRLAAHLSLALLIMQCLMLLAYSLMPIKHRPSAPLFIHGLIALIILCITICWGAFTAGLDAGLLYNDSFPKMGGQWVPPDFWAKDTLWANLLENHSAVQFAHRWLAITSVLAMGSFWAHGMLRKISFPALHTAMAVVILQFGLGIATLMTNVHLHVAATHQAGAVALLTILCLVLYQTAPRRA